MIHMDARVSSASDQRWRTFVLENTTLSSPPLIPEIKLYLAEESLPVWQKTLDELCQDNVPPPYWAFAWAGGQALARYLLDNPHLITNKTVLDLGAGSGLTALAARKAKATRVLAADVDQISCAAARLNAEANNLPLETTSEDVLNDLPAPFDVLLVGDLFYERPLANRVMAYLEAAQDNGSEILVGDPERTYFPRDRFTQLGLYDVPVSRELEDCDLKATAVWRLT